MSEVAKFFEEVRGNVRRLREDAALNALSMRWLHEAARHKYSYNFTWMGRPIIQIPQDIVAMQEVIWRVRPQVIVETGVAHGGSLIFHASMLQLVGEGGRVVGVDIDIRAHNRAEIESHPMARHIDLIQGSSVDPAVVADVRARIRGKHPVLVVLDSNHTHAHVAAELAAYSPFVRKGGYLIVLDTVIEDMPAGSFPDRPWDKGDNPKTAVHEFLAANDRFEIDRETEGKLSITVAPDGYLKCTKD